jgi:hypothetical protein
LHSKIDTSLALDNAGGLRLSKKQRLDDVNVTGEHKLRQAFLRRSLAYDLAGIATFAVLDLWTQKLFEKMNEAPLSNYRHISVEQVINADKALWVKVSNDTRGRLQPKTGADKPFDVSFKIFGASGSLAALDTAAKHWGSQARHVFNVLWWKRQRWKSQ